MTEFKRYRRLGYVEARPYVPGESLTTISVSDEDSYGPMEGGWVARNPGNHRDQWYISGKYFLQYFDQQGSSIDRDENSGDENHG
jgi:hypothetical protein